MNEDHHPVGRPAMTPSTNSEISNERDRLIHILVVHFDMFRSKAEEAADLFLHHKTLSRRSANSTVGGVEVKADCAGEGHDHPSHDWRTACLKCGVFRGSDLYTSPAVEAEPVAWRPTYEAISAMAHACRERQKAAGEGDQMLSRWISEGLDSLYTRSSPVSAEVTEPDEMLVAALKGLVLLKDLFDASDRNQADAYYILAKQDGSWGNARSALASINGGRENG